jgi:hypothetical protein
MEFQDPAIAIGVRKAGSTRLKQIEINGPKHGTSTASLETYEYIQPTNLVTIGAVLVSIYEVRLKLRL